jgi:hypothetical protein
VVRWGAGVADLVKARACSVLPGFAAAYYRPADVERLERRVSGC